MPHQHNQPLHLGTRFIAPSSYRKLQELLSPVLPMPGDLEDGDIAGIVIDFGVDPEGFFSLEPITELLLLKKGRYRHMGWKDLPHTHPSRVALAVIFAELSAEFRMTEIFRKIIEGLVADEQGRDTIRIILTPAGGIGLCYDYHERVLENRSWSQGHIKQVDVDDCMCLISPEITNSHDRLTIKTQMEPLHEIATQIFPIVWNEEDPVPLAFKAA